ncbi:type II toxin-antitoxin system HicA family toxin [Rhodococcoides yunnanense]|uniref:Type II toxin-antitoxin system HicA family toxin n=1 Tax=Rhodococcoides yunnanense TaxID=278209 RepID=A0ABU4BCP1_9NOCA|nr:type II toxin-antitoxin system HicA family toxin [Rhodococcus yunnanensis]MDV6261945.1 type II toxin-antitoxin system HicA family toxin [Rhodococcus yunnanensis]
MVKALKAAGFTSARTVGSHSTWVSADGAVKVTVPDGHRTISPGVYRKILAAMKEAQQ